MQCEVTQDNFDAPFDELLDSLNSQSYWVRFFMRPCCPPPGEEAARNQIKHLKSDIDAREDLSESQRDKLKSVADERLKWYLELQGRHSA